MQYAPIPPFMGIKPTVQFSPVFCTGKRAYGANTSSTVKRSLTEGDLEADEVMCVPEIVIVRGRPESPLVAGTRNSLRETMQLTFHYGREQFVVIDESLPLSRSMWFGTLPECVARFERIAQCKLPEIKVIEYGVGIWEAHSSTVSENPYALKPGTRYEVKSRRANHMICYVAVLEGESVKVKDEFGYVYDPAQIWDLDQWLSLREAAPSVQLATQD